MKKLLLLFSVCALAVSTAFSQDDQYYTGDEATVTVKAQEAPPPIPTYVQPECPGEGYLWEPGYWAWGADGYYWVPGVWVMPPSVGLLWTPGYWGFYGGYYGWHHGYWGPTIGYYGGINYGFGYFGVGFYGGRWEGGHFRYNSAVWHVNSRVIHNVYVDRGYHNNNVRVSFNGGPRGVAYRPAGGEAAAIRANHIERTHEQVGHEQNWGNQRGQFVHTSPRPAVHSMNTFGGQSFNQRGHAIAPSRGGGGGPRGGGHGGGGGGHGGGRHS